MFRKLTLLSAILALLVIVLGAYVRLSDAGLGCPDWPGCYGKALVSDSSQFMADAASQFPGAIVDTSKAWKEMSHRYLAGALGILVLVMLPLAWRQQKSVLGSSVTVLLLVVFQAALGMWAVQMKVMPAVVVSHLLVGLLIFWSLFWCYLRSQPLASLRPQRCGPSLLVIVAMLLLFLQIALGGWVSSNYAALACSDFPRCNGSYWPDGDYAAVFDWLNSATALSAEGKIAVHWLHRIGAVLSFAVLSMLMMSATDEVNPKPMRRAGIMLSLLLLIQIGLGILNIKQALPLWAAVAHNGFAGLLMLPLLAIYFYGRYALPGEDVAAELPTEDAVADIRLELPVEEVAPESLFLRLKTQLQKTRGSIGGVLSGLSFGSNAVTRELLEEVEAKLLMADIGMETTSAIIQHLTDSLEREQLRDGQALQQALKQKLFEMLEPCSLPLQIDKQDGPFVILVVGVNGAGKTTSIGKLAHRLQAQGHSVMLAAGDTFRAAAVEQLQTWGERNNVQVVAQHSGADSASVIFDALQSAKAKNIDVLIADTAGRLHTKSNLMEELSKIKRIMAKLDPTAPHEVLLILDAGTGQNALSQAKQFNQSVNLTGLALTKLDGTAKGGIIFALANQLHIPIRFIGVGEGIADLQDFDARTFVDALFSQD